YLTSDNFNLIVKKLKENPQMLIIDEIDYLLNNTKTIETLRDIHDETNCPVIFVGMGLIHRKLERHRHLYDRFSEIVKFNTFEIANLKQIFDELSEIKVTTDAIEYIHKKYNRFRQIVQLINQLEILAKENDFKEITKEIVEQII
ncbi:MAG: AAA family ATPase, partial [Candidatus Gastranaerophilales bacterium]